MRVVIAEDLALLRDGLTRLLESNGCEVVAAVADGDAFLEAAEEHRPDVCVVDVRLPPTFRDEGVRAALEARRRVPGLPILVLSQYVERTYAAMRVAAWPRAAPHSTQRRSRSCSVAAARGRRSTSSRHESATCSG